MSGLQQKVAKTAKRAGLMSGGAIFCAVGTGFLTVAGWFALAPVVGTAMTAAIIAGIYLGVGLIMIGLGAASSRSEPVRVKAPSQPAETAGPPIMQAFLYGLQAGASADNKRS